MRSELIILSKLFAGFDTRIIKSLLKAFGKQHMIAALFLISLAFSHPIFHFVFKSFIPNSFDPLDQHLILSLITIIPVLLMPGWPWVRDKLQYIVTVLVFVNSIWIIYVIIANSFRSEYLFTFVLFTTASGIALKHERFQIVYAIFVVVSFYLSIQFSRHGAMSAQIATFLLMLMQVVVYSVLRLRRILVKKQEQLSHRHRRIQHNLFYAARLQEAMLPKEINEDIICDFEVIYKPRDVVSGDFYWIEEKGDNCYIVLADCTGHGVPAALLSMMGMMGLKGAIFEHDLSRATDILSYLNKFFMDTLNQHSSMEMMEGMEAGVLVYNRKSKKLTFSGAGIALYLFTREKMKLFSPIKIPLGIGLFPVKYIEHEVKLDEDHMLYMFSDGATDQFGGKRAMRFTTKRLVNVLEEICWLPPSEQKEIIWQSITNWMKKEDQTDDISLMLFRLNIE